MAQESVQSSSIFIEIPTGSQEEFSNNEIQVPVMKIEDNPVNNDPTPVTEKATPSNPHTNIQYRRIRCQECFYYTAETEEKMMRHVRKVHRGENPFQCYMCDYSTYNKTLFEEHVRIHQGIKPFKCSFCPYRSVSKKNTKKHERIHRPDNPHRCQQCDFIGKHERALKHHLLSHSDKTEKKLKCQLCNDTFYKEKSFQNHVKGQRKCPECDNTYCSKLMPQHRFESHGVEPKLNTNKLKNGKVFTCALCPWQGNNKPRILLHLIHHPNQEVDESIVDTSVLRKLGIMAELTED